MSVDFAHRVVIDGTDVAGITLAGATITHGATGTSVVAEPASAYLELISHDAAGGLVADYPEYSYGAGVPSGFRDTYGDTYEGGASRLRLGAPVEVASTTPTGFADTYTDTYDGGFESVRFTGYITALDVTPALVIVTAVNAVEKLTRVAVSPAGWPAELDTERAARIATAAGVDHLRVNGDPTHTVSAVAADDSSTPTAWELLSKLAEDADALLYADRAGHLHYRTVTAHGGSTVHASPAATLLDGLQLTQELGTIVNDVTVTYGDPAVKLEAERGSSVADYGRRSKAISADVVDEAAAQAIADRQLDAYAEPSWRLTAATVNLKLAARDDPAFPMRVSELLDLDLDDELTIGELLPAMPVPMLTARVVGYTETLDPYAWALSFTLDPRRRHP